MCLCGRLFEEVPLKLSLKSLVSFLTELCEFSHQQLTQHSRQLSLPTTAQHHQQQQQQPHQLLSSHTSCLLLYRLGDIMARCIANERPQLHLMRVWSIASSHFVEVCCFTRRILLFKLCITTFGLDSRLCDFSIVCPIFMFYSNCFIVFGLRFLSSVLLLQACASDTI